MRAIENEQADLSLALLGVLDHYCVCQMGVYSTCARLWSNVQAIRFGSRHIFHTSGPNLLLLRQKSVANWSTTDIFILHNFLTTKNQNSETWARLKPRFTKIISCSWFYFFFIQLLENTFETKVEINVMIIQWNQTPCYFPSLYAHAHSVSVTQWTVPHVLFRHV